MTESMNSKIHEELDIFPRVENLANFVNRWEIVKDSLFVQEVIRKEISSYYVVHDSMMYEVIPEKIIDELKSILFQNNDRLNKLLQLNQNAMQTLLNEDE